MFSEYFASVTFETTDMVEVLTKINLLISLTENKNI